MTCPHCGGAIEVQQRRAVMARWAKAVLLGGIVFIYPGPNGGTIFGPRGMTQYFVSPPSARLQPMRPSQWQTLPAQPYQTAPTYNDGGFGQTRHELGLDDDDE